MGFSCCSGMNYSCNSTRLRLLRPFPGVTSSSLPIFGIYMFWLRFGCLLISVINSGGRAIFMSLSIVLHILIFLEIEESSCLDDCGNKEDDPTPWLHDWLLLQREDSSPEFGDADSRVSCKGGKVPQFFQSVRLQTEGGIIGYTIAEVCCEGKKVRQGEHRGWCGQGDFRHTISTSKCHGLGLGTARGVGCFRLRRAP